MTRRQWLAAAAFSSAIRAQTNEVFLERPVPGKPHAGKVLAAIQPHADDIPLFAAGTVAKLLDEGYTGHLIRTTNDDMAGRGTIAETALANERDVDELARVMGFQRVFHLNYGNHQMDGISRPKLRGRFIFLRPAGRHGEMAAGLKKSVREKYYFARGPQLVNRVVDISRYVARKIDANLVNRAQGPAGDRGAQLRRELGEKNLRLPLLGDDDGTASRNYIREFVLKADREMGRKYGVEYAEGFHYIGPEPSAVNEYIKRNAVPR